MGSLDRLLYVDDSGSDRFGWIVYGWVETTPEGWRRALRTWLEFRKQLWEDHRIPPSQELHATDYINGRGNLSVDPVELKKDLGRLVAEKCLAVLRDCPDIQVGAVCRHTNLRGKDYSAERGRVYEALVNRWDEELLEQDSFALVGMDGNGTEPSYFDAHRGLKLDTRRLIEDPMFHDSKRSQWTQMADLVAYIAYCHVDRHPRNEFAWEWYAAFLSGSDPFGEPQPLNS
ncbi:DUF3800 domain-containing protein [Frondihabitans sp. PhB188]|uniref:DUF3800 domain-containing protein n=1 Tax=Frondihabitans sp. PhB188 TaxID=2485200 RepID=UPI000F483216|nr:DUF3800 domain-containing protein [Frondihabitans sp. PhB188]